MIAAGVILLVLMTVSGILTRMIPPGAFERTAENGMEMIREGSFRWIDADPLPVWRWYTAPVEVLFGPDGVMIIGIIVFMCAVAGAVNILYSGGILTYLLQRIMHTFSGRRYLMEGVIILMLMLFGSLLGSMEEVVVLVPMFTALAVSMGWDRLTGLGLSLGAIAFGFAAALTNPFTIGAAQRIAGLPLFSGLFYRLIIFVTVYLLYTWYVITKSRQQEKISGGSCASSEIGAAPPASPEKHRALVWFAAWMAVMAAVIAAFSQSAVLSQYILPAVMVSFVAAGAGSGACAGMSFRKLVRRFFQGAAGIAPGIILILMAASIKHIVSTGGAMDTILYRSQQWITGMGPYGAVIMMYALVLVLNIFISSGSAKAFLVMPVITPLADIAGVSRQSAVLAYQFGDGFSNILYPTNALLLICLAISGVSYLQWLKWIWKIQLIFFLCSLLFLLIAVYIGY